MPSLPDLGIVTQFVVLAGLVFTASLIILIADWRLALFALAVQYVLAAVLLTQTVSASFAIVRAFSGAVAAIILYITWHRLTAQRLAALIALDGEPPVAAIARLYRPAVYVVGMVFRLLALALVALGMIGISSSMSFLGVAPNLLFGGLWLVATGILVAILSHDILRLGLGILLFTSGFCILESAAEGSLFVYGLLNVSDLLLAVVVAHLASVVPEWNGPMRRRGEAP